MFRLSIFVTIIFIVLILLLSFGLSKNINTYLSIEDKRLAIRKEISFWQAITDKYEGYKDAYFQIALLEYKLGEFKKAKISNNKSLLLDPNFESAKKLKFLLDNK